MCKSEFTGWAIIKLSIRRWRRTFLISWGQKTRVKHCYVDLSSWYELWFVIICIDVDVIFDPSTTIQQFLETGGSRNATSANFSARWTQSGGIPASTTDDNKDLNQGLLHLWSKFGDPSLNRSRVIARTSKWLTHRLTHTHGYTHTDAGDDNTRRPKLASGKNYGYSKWIAWWHQAITFHVDNEVQWYSSEVNFARDTSTSNH